MINKYFPFILVLFPLIMPAQQITEKIYFLDDESHGREIFKTNDGNYLTQSTVNNDYKDCLLMKIDPAGDTIWTKSYGNDTIQCFCYDMTATANFRTFEFRT